MGSVRLGRRGYAALFLVSLAALALGCGDEKRTYDLVPDHDTLRKTPLGEVIGGRGAYGDDIWLGVPYAQPPMGDLRWRPPKPKGLWPGVRQAIKAPAVCPQFGSTLAGVEHPDPDKVIGTEDCLYANIYAPHFTLEHLPKGDARLPVMVWIHGGGNSIGSASFYDGGHLARVGRVVVVNVQYRLGPLGWFHAAALREGQDEAENSGDFGTLDLIQALHWVHDNIEAFGGNPDQVTIFGESAGGMDVYSLLVAPRAKGLFQRAIIQSGALSRTTIDESENWTDDPSPGHLNSSNEVIAQLLIQDGKAKDRTEAKAKMHDMKREEIAAFLRERTQDQLFAAYQGHRSLGMIDMPLVIQDGLVLPQGDWADKLAHADGWADVPVMVGTNRDEAKLFLFFDPRRITKRFGVFPRFVDETSYQASAEYLSRTWKATGADGPAAAMSKDDPNVFVYRFDWRGEPRVLGADVSKMIGAAHGMEIPFVFGHFDLGRMARVLYDKAGEPSREALSKEMMSYWTEFAKDGKPGQGLASDQTEWTAWGADPAGPRFMILDVAASGGDRMSGEVESMEKIIADVDADPRLPTQRDKCRIFHDLTGWTHGLGKEDYPHIGKVGCAEFPFEKYPWDEKADK